MSFFPGMSEVSLEAESETITTDLQMDYKEDLKREDSLRYDENDDNYESVDLDKDHSPTDTHHVDSGFQEVNPQLDPDVQNVCKGACSDTDVENSRDAVITKGSADDDEEQHVTNHHTNTSETPKANGGTCPQTQVISASSNRLFSVMNSSLACIFVVPFGSHASCACVSHAFGGWGFHCLFGSLLGVFRGTLIRTVYEAANWFCEVAQHVIRCWGTSLCYVCFLLILYQLYTN